MQIVVQKAFGCARLFGAAQFVQGIAMQIPNLHDGYTPLCFFSQQLQQLFGVHGQIDAVCPAVTVSASDCLACCNSTIFSSMVSCAMSLYTCTGLRWPMR